MKNESRKEVLKRIEKADLTSFQKKVLKATYSIPKGQVRTYGQIARAIGHPNAYRAVGSVLKINPFAPTVPCHRVIKGTGALGNYSAPGGTRKKMQMLIKERAWKN